MQAASRSILLAAVLFSPAIAGAHPISEEAEPAPAPQIADRELDRAADTYFAGGAITGQDQLRFTGFFLESGHRMHGMLFGRVMGVAGATRADDRPGRGTYKEARVGAELRTCTPNGIYCGSFGLDLGMHRGAFTASADPQYVDTKPGIESPTTDRDLLLDGMMLAPRVTFDGGNRIRVRAVFELPTQVGERGTTTGVAVSLALGLGF